MGFLKAKSFTYKAGGGGGGGGGGSALTIKEEGSNLTTEATSIDFVGSTLTATESGGAVTVTDAGYSAASTSASGIVELATDAETTAGSDSGRPMTPSNLASITRFGTVTSGTLSTGAVLAGVTLTLGSDASGDTYYRNGSGVLTRLAKGDDDEVLTLANGIPSWAAAGGGGGGQTTGVVALSDGANISTDASAGNIFTITLGGNRTLDNPTNLTIGHEYLFRILQDGTGSRTLGYGSSFSWSGGSAPVLSTAAAAVDVIVAICTAADELICSMEFNFS